MSDTKIEERIKGVIRNYFFNSGIVHDPSIPAELASEIINAYRELHPPVTKGMRFGGADFSPAYCTKENEHKELDAVLLIEITRLANAKLQRILAQGVRVYGAANKYSPAMMTWETYQTPGHHTHRGIVINIEEVKDA